MSKDTEVSTVLWSHSHERVREPEGMSVAIDIVECLIHTGILIEQIQELKKSTPPRRPGAAQ